MIDTFQETVISIDDAAQHVSKISGKKRNRRVILRWINRGVSGVKLPGLRIAGEIYTSVESLNAFLNRSQKARFKQRSQATKEGIRRRKQQIETEADELGI